MKRITEVIRTAWCMKNRGSFGVHFGPGLQAGGAASLGQVPTMSLRKFVSHERQMGNDPKATTHSPIEDEMNSGMNALYGRIRPAKNQGGKVELTVPGSRAVWNPIKFPSKLFTK